MRPFKAMPAVEFLDEWFYEDPAGVLRWKKNYLYWTMKGKGVGEIAGNVHNQRYVISIFGCTYFRSRLIFKMHERREPLGLVDHINRDTLDDRFENLRDVTNSTNSRNTRARIGGDYFVVDTCTDDNGREFKRVRLTWSCQPDEDADAIAAHLNLLTENYLNNINAERLRRSLAPRPTGVDEGRLQTLLDLVRKEPSDDQQEEAVLNGEAAA